ncbi:hypothetical protein [Calothrix sp. 336/3]|uniref:hypothetical protein n=1 Tax=Calothrix sp. 336/3 TaxID=1337936 RepID=UPI0004E423BB|nr:hypothetical protein [Calothrix sp. 336/3]AKG20995.1 hypothetical protein IJ00_06505 [Calothrix sp. 336/3]
MQFLHSIKSAKALGLAAISAATMITANVAPTMAQTAPTRTITFHNAGFYNADFFITHSIPRQARALQAINLPLNQRRSFQVPLSASGTVITVTMRKNTDRGVFFQRQFLVDRNNICFQADGTLFNPSGRVVPC